MGNNDLTKPVDDAVQSANTSLSVNINKSASLPNLSDLSDLSNLPENTGMANLPENAKMANLPENAKMANFQKITDHLKRIDDKIDILSREVYFICALCIFYFCYYIIS